jgi:hypothetical protein
MTDVHSCAQVVGTLTYTGLFNLGGGNRYPKTMLGSVPNYGAFTRLTLRTRPGPAGFNLSRPSGLRYTSVLGDAMRKNLKRRTVGSLTVADHPTIRYSIVQPRGPRESGPHHDILAMNTYADSHPFSLGSERIMTHCED